MFSSAMQPPPRHPPRHNFVVSTITFEGFKLRSSNLTHALFIQISRTSGMARIFMFKLTPVTSKIGQGHPSSNLTKTLLRYIHGISFGSMRLIFVELSCLQAKC